MKQIEYNEKEKLVLEVLDLFYEYLGTCPNRSISKRDLFNAFKKVKEHYQIRNKFMLLRDYLMAESIGSYHSFIFEIRGHQFNVTGLSDFLSLYREDLLDNLYVFKDEKEDNGAGCDQYECEHHLTIGYMEE